MTRGQILSAFFTLSAQLHEAVEAGVITPDEATVAIDRYRERADTLLRALEREKVMSR